MKVSVIGTGFGSRVVGEVYREKGAEVTVVSPRDEAGVRAACEADVDLVSIHSPPFLHARDVGYALAAGRNVLCDKPFGMNAGEAQAMLEQAEAAGVLHFLNFEFRHDPVRSKVKALIDEGAIGTVRHLHWTAWNAGSRKPLRRMGWLFDKEQGGGWIGAFGSHVFDALRWLVGEVSTITGSVRTDVAERPDREGTMYPATAEDAFVASVTFENGATAVIDTAFAAPVNRMPSLLVLGSDGVIDAGATEIKLRGTGEDRTITVDPFEGDPHLPALGPWTDELFAAVRDKRQIAPNFADGLACARIMDAFRAAAVAR